MAKKAASTKGARKVHKVMEEHKEGKLKSGSGKKVSNRKQAVAIALSEARKSGAKIPKRRKLSGALMDDLTRLPNHLDEKKRRCSAIIETPKGFRSKFDYDRASNLFKLGGLLPEGMEFPFDFGFIPSTLGGDGDPLDILVLMDEPAHVGCLIDVRIVGVINARQVQNGKTESNDRLIGVAVHSYVHEDLETIDDVSKTILSQVEEFFVSYNKQRGKKFKIMSTDGPKKALKILNKSIRTYKLEAKKSKAAQ